MTNVDEATAPRPARPDPSGPLGPRRGAWGTANVVAVLGMVVLGLLAGGGAYWSAVLAIENARLETENRFYRTGLVRPHGEVTKTQDQILPAPVTPRKK